MPRIARIVAVEYPHHIVQRGNNKQRVFFDDEDRNLYLRLLKKYSSQCGCKVNAYCLMNNHVHLLLVPQHDNSLSKAMQKINLCYTQHMNVKYERTGRLWESRFHSSLVDREQYLWTVCRYIERNPIRAKVSNRATDYRWSSARVNSGERPDNLVEPVWQNDLERQQYNSFLDQPDAKDEIRKVRESTIKGKPIGKEDFVRHMAERLGVVVATRPRGRPRKL